MIICPLAGDSFSLPSLPVGTMMCISDIIAVLARASKSFFEIKEILQSVYGDKALKKMVIYAIIKKVKNDENNDD